eukprot:TRINITY_DN18227_c0_g1_i1.p1 TRINITY_DN18227_c0_g1~~TRINITY_DN18227_c0_g1_i1.p1  ORF type:complete len:689 (+),score=158.43 TRINITY_DN18227_c0_g1_i1:139-2205(+)
MGIAGAKPGQEHGPAEEGAAKAPRVSMLELENQKEHHTVFYRLKDGAPLVARRAAVVKFLLLDVPEQPATLRCTLVLQNGLRKVAYEATQLSGVGGFSLPSCACSQEEEKDEWSLTAQWFGSRVHMQLHLPSSVAVGVYDVTVFVGDLPALACPRPLAVICNPWARADDVFLRFEGEREEYVLEDDGLIFLGSAEAAVARPWCYSQYDAGVFEAAMAMVERCKSDRSDVVLLTRHLCALVNANNDHGVLSGNWSGDYSGGTAPAAWTGSGCILREWMATRVPVLFGQCWTFSAVLTTLCRSLGIPARPVTCYAAAHNTRRHHVATRYYDASGLPCEDGRSHASDALWHFHVWTDVWFRRRDLGPEHAGWQICDPTPQEMSGGYAHCGPASHVAVKSGSGEKHDSDFLAAEVDADVCFYRTDLADQEQEPRLVRIKKAAAGLRLATKAIWHFQLEDVTPLLKEMREGLPLTASHPSQQGAGVPLKMKVEGDMHAGSRVAVRVELSSDAAERWDCRLTVAATAYTGRRRRPLKQLLYILQPGQHLSLALEEREYLPCLGDVGFPLQATLSCVNLQTGARWMDELQFSLLPWTLTVDAPANLEQWRDAKVSFVNKLDINLTNCVLRVAGAGVVDFTESIGVVLSQKGFSKVVPLVQPTQPELWMHRRVQLVATLESTELSDIQGSAIVMLK